MSVSVWAWAWACVPSFRLVVPFGVQGGGSSLPAAHACKFYTKPIAVAKKSFVGMKKELDRLLGASSSVSRHPALHRDRADEPGPVRVAVIDAMCKLHDFLSELPETLLVQIVQAQRSEPATPALQHARLSGAGRLFGFGMYCRH